MLSQVSHAWQSWKNAKAVALLATLALAVGIGSTTAIYSIVDAVLLKPLPYEHSERFVALFGAQLSNLIVRNGLSYSDLLEYQRRSRSFDVLGWFTVSPDSVNLMFGNRPENVNSVRVTPSLVNNLGVRLRLGQWFRDLSGEPGGYNVVVLSNGLWRRLGADPAVVGKPLVLGGRQFTISGVAPPQFALPLVGVDRVGEENDLWVPLDPRSEAERPNSGMYICYARLRRGVTLVAANAEVKRIAAQIANHDPANHPSYTARLLTLRDSAVTEVRPALLLLFGAAGLLFLITCANVAGLMLARSIARARETAVRVALGATRVQLAQQYFTEGLVVSFAGASLGLLVSVALIHLVLAIAGEYNPFVGQTSLNARVFLFVFGAALLSSGLFSSAPLWQALHTTPNSVLTGGVRTSAGKPTRRLSQLLVVSEIALAFTLLGVGALLFAELSHLYRVSPGFNPDHLLTFQLKADQSEYSQGAKLAAYQQRLLQTFQTIPGVNGAAFTSELPLAGCCFGTRIYPDGLTVDSHAETTVNIQGVSPNYFEVMRIPLRRGRFLTARDTSETPVAVVIDQAAAKRYWPNRDPIGSYGHFDTATGSRFQVSGVVGDVRNRGLGEPTVPEVFLLSGPLLVNPMDFVVRSRVPTDTLVRELRQAALKADPSQPIYDVRPMSTVIQTSLALQRLSSSLISLFALVAVLMAALAVYGVVSYSVRQRTVEIGTRMALGAQNSDVFRLVLGDGFQMATYGVAIGVTAIAAATWLLFTVLKMVHEIEIGPFAYSLLIVAVVVLAASFFPAWRASLLSPMVAIRDESDSVWQSTRRGMRQLMRSPFPASSQVEGAHAIADATLLSDFISATRHAASFEEALRSALGMLCEKLGADSAMLLKSVADLEYHCVASLPPEGCSSCSLPALGFLSNRLRFYALPLPITLGDVDTWLRWAAENKPQYLPEIEALAKTEARVAVALRTKSEMLGLLLLGAPDKRSEYNPFEMRVLRSCAEQFALMMENAHLTQRVVEQEKLHRDVALAAEVQRRLLPDRFPQTAMASLAASSIPARSVGGDYYDFFDVGDHRIGIALADVAGKGIAAALIMSVVQASLRIISAEGDLSLPQLAAKLNRYLYRSTRSNSYATFFYAQIDDRNRQLRYVNAGHNPPYLLRSVNGHGTTSNGAAPPLIEELSTGGMIIGMFPQANYEEAIVDLQSGDVLLLFTDGVTEALSPGEEEFGEEQLKHLLGEVAHLPVEEMSVQISRQLKNWISEADQYDDLTFIVMKVN